MSYPKKAKKGYYGIAEYKTKDCKRHQKSAGWFKLKRQALAAADKLEQELEQLNVDLKDISLHDYFMRWFETHKEDHLSDVSNPTRVIVSMLSESNSISKIPGCGILSD